MCVCVCVTVCGKLGNECTLIGPRQPFTPQDSQYLTTVLMNSSKTLNENLAEKVHEVARIFMNSDVFVSLFLVNKSVILFIQY